MVHLLLRWSVLVLALSFVAGCAKVKNKETEDEPLSFPDRLAAGLPVFTDIAQPYLAENTDNALSLFSFDPENPVGIDPAAPENAPAEILASDADLMLSLDLTSDLGYEVLVVAQDDSIFTATYETDEIRRLTGLGRPICELLPAEKVVVEDKAYSVYHEEWVYVVTTSGSSRDDCSQENVLKYYQKLPLNYKFDAGDAELEFTNIIDPATEAEARSKLVFGWVDDSSTPASDDKTLGYGFVGYSFNGNMLTFFDEERNVQWEQERFLDGIIFNNPDVLAHEFIDLHRLDDTHYVMQLGANIFVFDATEIFFSDAEIDGSFLSDRALKLSSTSVYAADGTTLLYDLISPVEFVFDDQNVIFTDLGKIFHLDYKAGYVDPDVVDEYQILDAEYFLEKSSVSNYKAFSQFDLKDCAFQDDEAACDAAMDNDSLTNPSWQFITDCDEMLGCEFVASDFTGCVLIPTGAADETLCSSQYEAHLDVMDLAGNDARFSGYMQYYEHYMRDLKLQVYGDSLLVTAGMLEHDVLLRYFYNVDLSAPKLNRERILFGSRALLQGIDIQVLEDNLFVTALEDTKGVRTGECYIDGVRVPCRLSDFSEIGNGGVCTGKGLEEGVCTAGFKLYSSLALFCNAQRMIDGTCSDDEFIADELSSVDANTDARWVVLNDFSSSIDGVPEKQLYMLQAERPIEEDQYEGVLFNAGLVKAEVSDGSVSGFSSIGEFDRIEGVLGTGFITANQLARIDVVNTDPLLSKDPSVIDIYFVTNPEADFGSERELFKAGSRVMAP